jgi:hypothetical protein
MQPGARPAMPAATQQIMVNALSNAAPSDSISHAPPAEITAFPEFGQFSDLEVPGKWVRQRKQAGSVMSSCFLQFQLENEPQTLLCYYTRGFPAGISATSAYREIIAKPPHPLDMQERQSILEILRDKSPAKDFKITSLRTVDLDGRRALMVEGTFMISGLSCVCMFVDGGEGTNKCLIEEVSYIAPKPNYYLHYASIMRAFNKLTWTSFHRAALFK